MSIFKNKRTPGQVSNEVKRDKSFRDNGWLRSAQNGEIVFTAPKRSVPIIDAAIIKLIRLTGGFHVECRDANVMKSMQKFLEEIDTGRGQKGISSFLDCYLDSMITCGRAVGEIVLRGRSDIAAVLCGNVSDIEIREGKTPLDFEICSYTEDGQLKNMPYQELLLFHAVQSRDRQSVRRVASQVNAVHVRHPDNDIQLSGTELGRAGNVRLRLFTSRRAMSLTGRTRRRQRADSQRVVRGECSPAKNGCDTRLRCGRRLLDIKVIGADNQVLDSEVPVRQILEQLVARTGIPPFMLGLSWSSTERMSSQQADIITSELTAIRRTLTPVVRRICDMWLKMHGEKAEYEIVWDDINLQDEVEEAHAELYRAQAEFYRKQARKENGKKEND